MPSNAPSTPRRWSGLDGLRALAVIAVVAFHFAPGAVPGGFLGVDVFFVLSGYLITRMIATEYLESGRLRFAEFYRRRARRLLPGLAVVLAAVLAAAAFWRDQLTTVRPASLAAAGYVSNWWLSFDHQSYFVSAGRPSMLQHLWSLAVEEQFYLVWPVLAIGVLVLAGRIRPGSRRWALGVVATLLALGSAAEMAWLAIAEDAPYATDASRLYYGTDTHSMGLLLGAAFGALAAGGTASRRRLLWVTDAISLVAVAGVLATLFVVGESSPGLYRGGFLAVAAATALAAACVARAGSRAGRLLDRPPMRWLAARSYAIYLWHWPIAVVTRPGADLHWPLAAVLPVRILATLLLADITYRAVELPIRARGLRASLSGGVHRVGRVITGDAPVGARLGAAVLATGVLLAGSVLLTGPRPTLSAEQRALASAKGGESLSLDPAQQPGPSISDVARLLGGDGPTQHPAAPTSSAPPPSRPAGTTTPKRLPPISAFGDSVILGAKLALQQHFPGGTLDAVEGRQADPILADVVRDVQTGRINPLVIIHVGDNGLIGPDALRQALTCLRHVRQVIVVNDRVGRDWQNANNRTIAKVVPRFPNATVLDWHAIGAQHAGWFYDDGIHLTPPGAAAYAALLAQVARRAI